MQTHDFVARQLRVLTLLKLLKCARLLQNFLHNLESLLALSVFVFQHDLDFVGFPHLKVALPLSEAFVQRDVRADELGGVFSVDQLADAASVRADLHLAQR